MPKPLTADHAQHLADYVLERLAEGLDSNADLTGKTLAEARFEGLVISLQRLVGALGGEAAELRLVALLGRPARQWTFGATTLAIAESRALAAAEARHTQALPTAEVA